MIQDQRQLPTCPTPKRAACTAALVTALGAVACAVCCVLPFALPAVALAMSGGALAWLAGAYAWATSLAAVVVVAAWLWVLIASIRSKVRPASSTLYAMICATAAFGLAVVWPRLELHIIRLLKS